MHYPPPITRIATLLHDYLTEQNLIIKTNNIAFTSAEMWLSAIECGFNNY